MQVSVIIPVYNMSRFVKECIESVQRQTLQDLEMLLIDDGSTDNSRSIICYCQKIDNRIRYFYQKNSGAGAARNLGLHNAKGDYVAFLDSDDFFYHVDALERMVNACKCNHISICASYRNELKNGKFQDADLFKSLGYIPPEGRRVSFIEHQNDFFFQSYLYQRSFIQAHNLCFKNYRRYEDPPFLLQALDLCEDFWLIPTTLHCYRKGHQNWSKNGIYIVDSLSGLLDNMLLCENKYPLLYQRLICRIDQMYRSDILNNPSQKLDRILQHIYKVYLRNITPENHSQLLDELFFI